MYGEKGGESTVKEKAIKDRYTDDDEIWLKRKREKEIKREIE